MIKLTIDFLSSLFYIVSVLKNERRIEMSTSSKRGRPFSEESPLRYDTKVRLDKPTHDQLVEYSEKHNVTIAEVIRRAIKAFLGK